MKKLIRYEIASIKSTMLNFVICALIVVAVFVAFLIFVHSENFTFLTPLVIFSSIFIFNDILSHYSPLLARNEVLLYRLLPVNALQQLLMRQLSSLVYFALWLLPCLVAYFLSNLGDASISLHIWHFFMFLGIFLLNQSLFVLSVIVTNRLINKSKFLWWLKPAFDYFEQTSDVNVGKYSAYISLSSYMVLNVPAVAALISLIFLEHTTQTALLFVLSVYCLNPFLLYLNSHILEKYGIE